MARWCVILHLRMRPYQVNVMQPGNASNPSLLQPVGRLPYTGRLQPCVQTRAAHVAACASSLARAAWLGVTGSAANLSRGSVYGDGRKCLQYHAFRGVVYHMYAMMTMLCFLGEHLKPHQIR